jgi:predicted DNA-binding ribbon-helix-helix protein
MGRRERSNALRGHPPAGRARVGQGRAGQREGEAMSLPPKVKSAIAKRSVFIGPRKTSITLEGSFWEALKEIAVAESLTPGRLVTRIDQDRQHANLSSAIRLFVLDHYRRLAADRVYEDVKAK